MEKSKQRLENLKVVASEARETDMEHAGEDLLLLFNLTSFLSQSSFSEKPESEHCNRRWCH